MQELPPFPQLHSLAAKVLITGSYKNVNNHLSCSNAASLNLVDIEGGDGNDTIYLDADNYSALNVNANKGADDLEFVAFSGFTNSIVGLGAGNDIMSAATIASAATSTVAGGKGNDTIVLQFTNASNTLIGGDRANANPLDGDGNDSIWIKAATVFTASTIYGGGGNDTVTFSGDMSASVVSMGAGSDVFSAQAANIIKDSTIGMGNQGDELHFVAGVKVLSSKINLGKGLDTTDFGDDEVGSGALYANTTINGGLGADYLLGSATLSAADTAAMILEYTDNSESTISAYDTVALDVNGSGTYQFRYEPGLPGCVQCWFDRNTRCCYLLQHFATDVPSCIAISTNTTAGDAGLLDDLAMPSVRRAH